MKKNLFNKFIGKVIPSLAEQSANLNKEEQEEHFVLECMGCRFRSSGAAPCTGDHNDDSEGLTFSWRHEQPHEDELELDGDDAGSLPGHGEEELVRHYGNTPSRAKWCESALVDIAMADKTTSNKRAL